jgi:hypothetical protein
MRKKEQKSYYSHEGNTYTDTTDRPMEKTTEAPYIPGDAVRRLSCFFHQLIGWPISRLWVGKKMKARKIEIRANPVLGLRLHAIKFHFGLPLSVILAIRGILGWNWRHMSYDDAESNGCCVACSP